MGWTFDEAFLQETPIFSVGLIEQFTLTPYHFNLVFLYKLLYI
jgi:hypothetical protein